MRLTLVLNRNNIGRYLKANWSSRSKLKIHETSTEEVVKSFGYEVVDINEVLKPPKSKEKIEFVGFYKRDIPLDKNHPDYKLTPCYKFNDGNVLLEGLDQAKVLTNTVELSQNLQEILEKYEKKIDISDDIHIELEKRIQLACVLEATQAKLPKRKDPLRPAWNFPRDYGIPDTRKNELLCKNLLTLCQQLGNNLKEKSVVEDAFFIVPLEAHNKKIQIELTSELLVTSKKRIKPFVEPSVTHSVALPDIHPVDCTISLNPVNFYEMKDFYPINVESKWPFVQLAFTHFNHTQTKNLYGEQVTEEQICGRTLMKSFCIGASQARALYGEDVKELPEPIVVPVVHTDGEKFYFGVYQLNTMEIDKNTPVKNVFWNCPGIELYSACEYKSGRPILENYNPNVLRKLLCLYNLM